MEQNATQDQTQQVTHQPVVVIQGRLDNLKIKKTRTFLYLRSNGETLQCVKENNSGVLDEQIKLLAPETILRLTGRLQSTPFPVRCCTRTNEELHLEKIEVLSKPTRPLPFSLVDAERSTLETSADAKGPTVSQAHRLDHRSLDLRTLSNHRLFQLNSQLVQVLRQWLYEHNFLEIFTPKIIGGASEGGADVFSVDYYGGSAFLTQSPQLYKQMAINGDLGRVFEVGPVFRAEKSHTHRHLSQFTGFDLELEVDSYEHLLQFAESFVINLLEWQNGLSGAKVLHWIPDTKTRGRFNLRGTGPNNIVRLDYWEAIDMLNHHYGKSGSLKKSDPDEGDPSPENWIPLSYSSDLSLEQERTLGQLVQANTGVDFFILNHFPLENRAFYTAELPSLEATALGAPSEVRWSYGFDLILCGEEISSGALRINDPKILRNRCLEKAIDPDSLGHYLESFEYGSPLHGGFGLGLERILMLLFQVPNVKLCSLFPRYPERVAP